MNQEQLDHYRQLIEALLEELQNSDSYLKDATRPIEPDIAIGRLTRMEAIGEKSVNEAMHANVKKRIGRLNNAVDRIEKGTYGICIRCGKEIPAGRLEAVPESLICVPCAGKKR